MDFSKEIVNIEHLSKYYGRSFKALDDVNLNLQSGRIVGLLGPNGSGKTTLLKILAGMILEHEGSVKIDGNEVGLKTKPIVAYLPDTDFFDGSWNAEFALNFYGDFFQNFNKENAIELMRKLGIDSKKSFSKLSKGNREKVQLIFTLSRDAKVYLFDEPIAGVDPAAREFVFRLITENCEKDALVLISTHLISDAERILDDFIFIKQGKVVRCGNVKETVEKENKSIDQLFREDFACF